PAVPHMDHQETEPRHHDQPGGEPLKDPVCGMSVTRESPHRFEYQGQDYYFCSGGCRTRFADSPERYLNPQAHAADDDPVAANTWYTCPMDPEVRQLGPGTCPKCGMALEPEMPTLSEEENPELTDFSRR